MKKTKIIATIGPSSETPAMIESLAMAGMDVCRLNFSFGTHEQHLEKINMIRAVSKKIHQSIGILLDLQGPKIRVGKLKNPVALEKGQRITLYGGKEHNEETLIPTTYAQIAQDTIPEKIILMADGTIRLQIEEVDRINGHVHCRVIHGGTILTGKGINLPYTKISLPALTEKDIEDVRFGIQAQVDFIALSFVRSAEDVIHLRNILDEAHSDIPIIAKIEKPEALDCLDEILDHVEGCMVARGDLAVEISIARIPLTQKEIILRANKKGKITITATEMLNSMIENPNPTRAEATDVANALLDGTDAIMLSGETALGKYPITAVETMTEIAFEIEKHMRKQKEQPNLELASHDTLRDALCASASYLSHQISDKAMMVLSRSGTTTRILSKYRPDSIIHAATNQLSLYYRMTLYHNVHPIMLEDEIFNNELSINHVLIYFEAYLQEHGWVQPGDQIIALSGSHDKKGWTTNTIQVRTIY